MLLTWSTLPFPPVVQAALQFFWFLTFTLLRTLRASNTCNPFIPVSLTIFIFLCTILKRSFDGHGRSLKSLERQTRPFQPSKVALAYFVFFLLCFLAIPLGWCNLFAVPDSLGRPHIPSGKHTRTRGLEVTILSYFDFLRRVLPCFQLLKTVS